MQLNSHHSNDLRRVLSHALTPFVEVDGHGQMVWGNHTGLARFVETRCCVYPLASMAGQRVHEISDCEIPVILPMLLRLSCPVQIAVEGGLIHLLPLPRETTEEATETTPRALLEWVLDSGSEKLSIFQDVSKAVNSSLILEDIFDSLGEVLLHHIPFEEAVIVILDDTQNGIKTLVRFSSDGLMEITGESNMFAGNEPLVDRMLKRPASGIYSAPELPQTTLLPADSTAMLMAPLVNKGVVIGVIALSTAHSSGFTVYQESLLKEVSSQIAVAVENAKFYWQTQAQAGREFLINQLTRSIRQSLNIEIILGTAVTELGKVLGVSRCFIRYFAPDTEEKTFQYQLPGITRLPQAGLALERDAFQLRKDQATNPFILNDVRDCPSQWAEQIVFEATAVKSLAVIPILVRDILVGSISLHQCDAYRAWVPEDIDLLRAMAEHLGVALNQAQLFLELDLRKQALEGALEDLQQAQLYLIQSEKMAVLGQFVAGIAHEVNTPLGTMISNNATLTLCLEKLKPILLPPESVEPALPDRALNAKLVDGMDNLLSLNRLASSRIQEIVSNLRNFARLDESEMKTVDLKEGIESTLLLLRSSMDPTIELIRNYSPDVPPVQCYPGLLNQVFMNLIVNASHALLNIGTTGHKAEGRSASDAGLSVELDVATQPRPRQIEIIVRPKADGQTVQVVIRDTGKGIAPENLAKVFDPGFTTKGVGVGTGLGLALCYRIVEKHQGRISVDSVRNEGTAFTVDIPIRPPGSLS